MADVVCLGELLIDFVPTVTGTDLIATPGFKKAPGGAPANVAAGLARLGRSSAFMGMVGDDPFGHYLAQVLREVGVDVTPLRYSSTARTALAFVSLRADGEREFMFYRHPSADMLFAPEDVDAAAIRNARALHFGSISLIAETSRRATLHAVALAREAGVWVSYDPNLRLALWPDADTARRGLLQGMAEADVIKLSEDEVEFLIGSSEPEAARRKLWHEGLRLMVITHGSGGCHYLSERFEGDVASFPVTAVDATGAGDAFVAGLLQGLLAAPGSLDDEQQLRDLCRFANAVGALTTQERGAIPALPDRAQVERFLARHAGVAD